MAVTGAYGYLGSHVVEALVRAGCEVRAVASPWGAAKPSERHGPGVETVRADVTVPETLGAAFAGCDAVVHAAARVADWGPWTAFRSVNVEGTRNVARAAAAAGARRVVLVSSLAVFRYRGFRGEDPRVLPRDAVLPYGRSKVLAEDAVRELAPEPVVVRPALWPYGAGDASLARVAAAVRRGAFPLVDGGRARLQTVDARFLADVLARCATAPAASGRSYLVADDGAPTWRELVGTIAELLGAPRPRLRVPGAPLEPLGAAAEALWARLAPEREPPLTRYRAVLMRRDVVLDDAPVRDELGMTPWRDRRDALRDALGVTP